MDRIPTLLAAMLVAAIAALYLQRLGGKLRRSRRARRRSTRAQRGERDAESLVSGLGYAITERQAAREWTIDVDGEPMPVELRADLLVERDGKCYVAEVKTGEVAPRLSHAATRRQLLEYRCAYPVDGILLVDVEAGVVSEVSFALPTGAGEARRSSAPRPAHLALLALICALAGAVLGWLIS